MSQRGSDDTAYVALTLHLKAAGCGLRTTSEGCARKASIGSSSLVRVDCQTAQHPRRRKRCKPSNAPRPLTRVTRVPGSGTTSATSLPPIAELVAELAM